MRTDANPSECGIATVHLFEPFHGTTENAMFGQRLEHIGRHDTQILANNHATSTGSLKRECRA